MALLQLKNQNPIKWVILFILISILIISLFGCSPEFYCKRCPVKTKDSIVTIVKDSISFRDTTIFISGDSIIFHDSIPCPDFNREFHTGRATIKVIIKDHYLTAECICDSIAARLKTFEYWHKKILANFHSEVKEVFKTRPNTWFNWLSYFQSWICISIFVLYGFLKYLKITKKLIIPFI